MSKSSKPGRRRFIRDAAALGTIAAAGYWAAAQQGPATRIKVGVIGCGSVSTKYFPHLAASPFVELVSACDIKPDRAKRAAEKYKIADHYPHIDAMLGGAAFDLLVNLTDMQEHERLNRQAITAGKHVWSEKPIANSLDAGQELLDLSKQKGTRLWGAPTVVNSPQFKFMAKTLAGGTLGRVAAAHASYGHLGPNWSAFFYEKGGGSMPDLGVYNLTTLTGLLGPAKSVIAMTSIVTPTRKVGDKGEISVTAEDNAMVTLDHGGGVLSHVQCGFNYFSPEEHDDTRQGHHTITITGTGGAMAMAGFDWAPHGVDVATRAQRKFQRHSTDKAGYVWQQGASIAAECLATGKEPPFKPQHALHVVEIMTAARQSQESGRRVELRSTFEWPVVA